MIRTPAEAVPVPIYNSALCSRLGLFWQPIWRSY